MMNKSEWKKVKLGDFIVQIRGVTYKKDEAYEKEKENFIPILRANNIKEAKIIYNDVIFVNQNNISENQILRKNDILICTSSGSIDLVGKAGQINKNENISFGAFCKVIRILDENKLNPLYLNYFFQSNYYKQTIKKIAQGANINNLRNGDIDNLELKLYSLEKQKYIGDILNKISNILDKRKEQLLEFENLVKFQFLKMFGDLQNNPKGFPIVTLEELGKWSSGGTPSRAKKEYYTGNIDWYSAGELNSLYLNGSLEKITTEAINNSTAKLFKAGSMLIGMYDTAAFKMGILKKLSSSNQACACIEPNEKINIVWLYYALLLLKNYFLHQRRGVRQKNLNLGMIKSFKIPYVDKKEQNKFADFVKQADKSKVTFSNSSVLEEVA